MRRGAGQPALRYGIARSARVTARACPTPSCSRTTRRPAWPPNTWDLRVHGALGLLIRAIRRGQRTAEEVLVLLEALPLFREVASRLPVFHTPRPPPVPARAGAEREPARFHPKSGNKADAYCSAGRSAPSRYPPLTALAPRATIAPVRSGDEARPGGTCPRAVGPRLIASTTVTRGVAAGRGFLVKDTQ